MSNFTWQEQYRIGNATVDEQHQYLFELANQLIDEADTDEITRLLMLFYQHVRTHFQDEEALMKQHHYPGYALHVAAHDLMLDKLVDISRSVPSGEWTPADIQAFVDNWLKAHILEVDMLFGEFLKRHGQT